MIGEVACGFSMHNAFSGEREEFFPLRQEWEKSMVVL